MSDTPETDAHYRPLVGDRYAKGKTPDFCRRLERERNDLLSRLTALEHKMPEELARLERERDEARRAIPQWQPIETAPRDGREILAYKPDYGGLIYMVRWCQPEGQGGVWVQESGGPWHIESELTHWMPLPPPPSIQPTQTNE